MKPATPLLVAVIGALATMSASAIDPHDEAVTRVVTSAKGKVEKTLDGESLRLIDLAVPGAGPHDHRTEDPYDAAFFEHVGHITTLESLNVISTKFNDDWIPYIAKLTNLKALRFTNNGKFTDGGMAQLAELKNLETLSIVGTQITGKAYATFEGFTKLTRVSHRGSQIDDEGLRQLCEHLPNLESISLAHAKFTDADLKALSSLKQLEHIELGKLPLTDERIAILQDFRTLKSMRLVPAKEPFSPETQAKISALLPKTKLEFK